MKLWKYTIAVASVIVGIIGMAAISGEPAVPADQDQPAMTDETLADEHAPPDIDPDLPGSAAVDYDLSWYKIAGGGETYSTGDGYSLGGTIGQYDAGAMEGGDYTLAGGFWAGGAVDVEPDCPTADLNCDGVVDGADLLILLSAWGNCADPDDCPADLNDDGVVDGADLLILLSNWG